MSDNGTRMTQIRWMTAKIKSFDSYVLLSNIKTHLPLKCFLCRNTDENVKLFWYSLIITIRGQKRTKMRQKGVLKVPSWKKIIFQLRKNIFQQGNKIFPTGRFWLYSWFYFKLFLCKVFLYWQLCGKGVFGVAY